MSDDEDLRRAFAKEMDEDADDESSDDGGTHNNRIRLLNIILLFSWVAIHI